MRACLGLVLAALLLACVDGSPPPASAGEGDERLLEAIDRARGFLAQQPRDNTGILLFLDILHRRFGLEEFAGMADEYERLVASMPRPAPDVFSSRRVLDASTRIDPALLKELVSPVNRITHPALHARELPLPAKYATRLRRATERGGYDLTHAGLALIWLAENEQRTAVEEPFFDEVAAAMAALLDPADGVDDLEIESATFLHALDRGGLVPRAFIEAVVAAQQEDGGWPSAPGATPPTSNDHTSALALWLLLEATRPPASKGPTLAR